MEYVEHPIDDSDPRPLPLSTRYSFRYNGKALRIYHGKDMEQVTLAAGGSFGWSDDGKGYSLRLKENKVNGYLEALNESGEPIQGPADMSGVFVFSTNDPATGETLSLVEIKP